MARNDFYYNNIYRSYPFEMDAASMWDKLLIEADIQVKSSNFVSYPLCCLEKINIEKTYILLYFGLYNTKQDKNSTISFNIAISKNAHFGDEITITENDVDATVCVGDIEGFLKTYSTLFANAWLLPTKVSWIKDYIVQSISCINQDRKRIYEDSTGAIRTYGDMPFNSNLMFYPDPANINVKNEEITLNDGYNSNIQVNPCSNSINIGVELDNNRINTLNLPLGYYLDENTNTYKQEAHCDQTDTYSGGEQTTQYIKCINNAIGPYITITGNNISTTNNEDEHSIAIAILK